MKHAQAIPLHSSCSYVYETPVINYVVIMGKAHSSHFEKSCEVYDDIKHVLIGKNI